MNRSLAIGRVAKHFHRDHQSQAKIFSRFDDDAVDSYDDDHCDYDDDDDDDDDDDNDDDDDVDDDDHDHNDHYDDDAGTPQPKQNFILVLTTMIIMMALM